MLIDNEKNYTIMWHMVSAYVLLPGQLSQKNKITLKDDHNVMVYC